MKWAVIDQLDRYDAIVYLPKQFDIVDDGVRQPEHSEIIEATVDGFLGLYKSHFPNYVEIWSDEEDPQEILKDRVRKIKKYLKSTLTI